MAVYKRMNQFCNHLCFEDQKWIILRGKKIYNLGLAKEQLGSFLIFFWDCSCLIFQGHLWINFSVANEIDMYLPQKKLNSNILHMQMKLKPGHTDMHKNHVATLGSVSHLKMVLLTDN